MLINHLHCDTSPVGPQPNWQGQVFGLFWKVRRVGAEGVRGKVFHRAGAVAEKALFLDPTSQNNQWPPP